MGKFFKRLMVVVIAVVVIFTFAGCTGEGEKDKCPPHNIDTTTWAYDSTYHYHPCSWCNLRDSEAEHTFDNDGVCIVCKLDSSHEHEWGSEYQKDAEYHWKKCLTCEQKKELDSHNMVNHICSVCGYQSENITAETIPAARDLKVYTYQTVNAGVFTYVELPDGRNMLIDSGINNFQACLKLEGALLDMMGNLAEIDYLILTSTSETRCGGVSYLNGMYQDLFKVKNFYYPDTTGATYSISSDFTEAKNILAGKNGCKSYAITDDSDITKTFKEQIKAGYYTYTIDFTVPVSAASASDEFDNQVYVSITYNDKTILLTGDTTNKNIDGYITKSENVDVDVLITGFNGTYFDAITNSASRNSQGFLQDTKIEDGDYAIITYYGSSYIEDLDYALRNAGINRFSFTNLEQPRVITTITHNGGTLTVEASN